MALRIELSLGLTAQEQGNCGLKSRLDGELDVKRVDHRTERNLPTTLRNGKKDSDVTSKSLRGTMLVFLGIQIP